MAKAQDKAREGIASKGARFGPKKSDKAQGSNSDSKQKAPQKTASSGSKSGASAGPKKGSERTYTGTALHKGKLVSEQKKSIAHGPAHHIRNKKKAIT